MFAKPYTVKLIAIPQNLIANRFAPSQIAIGNVLNHCVLSPNVNLFEKILIVDL